LVGVVTARSIRRPSIWCARTARLQPCTSA
jgi:hypothetical protein